MTIQTRKKMTNSIGSLFILTPVSRWAGVGIRFVGWRVGIQLEVYGAMVALLYVRIDRCLDDITFQRICNADIIDPPTFIFLAHRGEALRPPGIMVRIGIQLPEAIYPTAAHELIHPDPLLRQKAGVVLIPLRIMNVDRVVGD